MILFVPLWFITLLISWVALSTPIFNSEKNSKAFKIKSIFFWVSIIISCLGGYYLTK